MFSRLFKSKKEEQPTPEPVPSPVKPSAPASAPVPAPVKPATVATPAPVQQPIPEKKSARTTETQEAPKAIPSSASPATPKTDGKPPIDWKEALNQVGGDREFLNEVLQDLLDEAKTAEDDIAASIDKRDFGGVMRAAHRIKGSASYLSCDPLRDISYKLQQSGHAGEGNPTNMELWPDIEKEYAEFQTLVNALRKAIALGVPSDL